jgi:opacity protein-like surface antigen
MTRRNNAQGIVLGACLAAGAGAVQAQSPVTDHGVYLGVGLGQSEAKEFHCEAFPECDRHGTPVKYFVGYKFSRHWSAELGFSDLGKFHAGFPGAFQDNKVHLGEATIVGSYPATARYMIYGKAGAYYAKTTIDVSVSGTSLRRSEDDWGPTWGFGLQYYVTHGLAIRGEVQRYMKVGGGDMGETDIDAWTIGALYKF